MNVNTTMTMKEVEERSGMTRANIRFYEQQGLLHPQRAENGYRIYDEDTLQELLRIKLLRSLSFSLEEIADLQRDGSGLPAALERRLQELLQEQEQRRQAMVLCRHMALHETDYAALQPQQYLDYDPAQADTSGWGAIWPLSPAAKEDKPKPISPWRRYFARLLDLSLYALPYHAVLMLCFNVNFSLPRVQLLTVIDSIVGFLLMLLIEPLLLHRFGTTPGKWLLGLRVEYLGRGHWGWLDCLNRTYGVVSRAYGWGIPFYSLYRMAKTWELVKAGSELPWDTDCETMCTGKPLRWQQVLGYLTAQAVFIAATVALLLLAQLPPNRGDLTVAEFAENYNDLADYYSNALLSKNDDRLSPDGTWQTNDAWEDNPGWAEWAMKPTRFTFATDDDGYITAVTLVQEKDPVSDNLFIESRTQQLYLTALALVGAQPGSWKPAVQNQTVSVIMDSLYDDFAVTIAGVTLHCDVEMTGCISGDFGVYPDPTAEHASFYRTFTAELR